MYYYHRNWFASRRIPSLLHTAQCSPPDTMWLPSLLKIIELNGIAIYLPLGSKCFSHRKCLVTLMVTTSGTIFSTRTESYTEYLFFSVNYGMVSDCFIPYRRCFDLIDRSDVIRVWPGGKQNILVGWMYWPQLQPFVPLINYLGSWNWKKACVTLIAWSWFAYIKYFPSG